MGFLPKGLLNKIWGVHQPATKLDDPLKCDACRIARVAGKDACPEHHDAHPRAHTYSIGHQIDYGSFVDSGLPPRPSLDH